MLPHRQLERHRALEAHFESLPIGHLRCPVCWQRKPVDQFSKEHVPPQSVNSLIREGFVADVVTCTECNNGIGSRAQHDLALLIKYQRWVHGAGDDVPGYVEITGIPGRIRVNARWVKGGPISIAGVPKANNPAAVGRWTAMLESGDSDWKMGISHQFFYPERAFWGILHSAYLLLVRRTDYRYAYSRAGALIRDVLNNRVSDSVANYCLASHSTPIPGPNGFVVIQRPLALRGYLVKVAGQLIPMPLEGHTLAYYKRWWARSRVDRERMLLLPRIRHLSVSLVGRDLALIPHLPIRGGTVTSVSRGRRGPRR